jgi:hypothetical protein
MKLKGSFLQTKGVPFDHDDLAGSCGFSDACAKWGEEGAHILC